MKEIRRGWVRFIGTTPSSKKVIHGEIYPCLITYMGEILLPDSFGDYCFTPGVMFEIVDPFLININKILE